MKIVYTIEDLSIKGGAEHIITEKANIWASVFHHEVTIISIYHDERPYSYALHPNVKVISLDVPFVPKDSNRIHKNILRVKVLLLAFRRFQQIINQIKPDFIFYTMSLGALLLPIVKTKAKKIYESHSSRSFTPYHQLFRWMEKKADAIVCLTTNDAKEYIHTKKVCVIPNFINQPICFVKNYNYKRAIAVGRLEPPKGFDRLINCWKEVAQKYSDWKLDIYGEGSLHDALQAQIKTLHLEQQITLCGRKENMLYIYPNYSLHLVSSHYEGQSIVLIEAQACGLPSVTFNYKYGAKEIVNNGENGILVEQDNETAFVNAVCKMIENPRIREYMGKNALQIGKQYSKENIFKKWQELLLTLEVK